MYNRYIPQPDGTYQRNRIQDPGPQRPPEPQPPLPVPEPPMPEPKVCPGCSQQPPVRRPVSRSRKPPSPSISGFLKNLLPRELDAEDLLVILLLLLMSGDCREDQNTALLTLVIYLFL